MKDLLKVINYSLPSCSLFRSYFFNIAIPAGTNFISDNRDIAA